MADNKRLARELETREADERPKQWQPANTLPEPEKESGYGYRWVRVSTLNNFDPRNISAKTREGWEFVKVEEQPHMEHLVESSGKFPGCIEIGGLVLCKMPIEMTKQRETYFAQKNKQQMDAVDSTLMRENDPRMPLFKESKSSVERSFGTGEAES
jgi:hypothetical protein